MITHRHPTGESPARVVVLGASGFIGAALVARLNAAGVSVSPLSSRDLDLTAPDAGDRLAALLRADDTLVFASAITREKGRDPRTMMRNLTMAEGVVAAVETRPCAHVVYLSSDAVYPEDASNPVSESTRAAPTDLYGLMHLVRERMLAHSLGPLGIPLAILRPSIVYGPGDTHGSYGPNRFLRTARAGNGIALFGEGEERRDHVFIDDVTWIVEQVLRRRSEGVLNLATGTSVSFADVAATFGRITGVRDVRRQERAVPLTHREYDVSVLRAAFPEFRPISINAGVERTWASE